VDDKQLYTIIMRHDTSTQWAVNNPILTYGEYAVEDDTHRVKRGDGETEWNDLPYEEFGLVYLVTYENLSGEVSDNEALQQALDKKMSIAVFEDVDYSTVSSIEILGENGAIARLTKITKNIDTAVSESDVILIRSTDNSIQGYWSTTQEGVRILNLRAICTISDYEVGRKYYKDHLCFYQNRLYRALEEFEAERDFNPNHWVILASKHAEDVFYDNLASELDATTVQGALDEIKRRNDTKVTKSTEQRVVYGTTQQGGQTVIPIDDLRTVDSVNGVRATDQLSKNIQLDANDINYDDNAQDTETIKEKLDQKVDKNVAGEGVKIVRDIQFNYNSDTGHITLTEDKVSLEDGSSVEEEREIDVVSEKELDDRVDAEVETLNGRITTEVATINDRIDTEVETLNDTIDATEQALQDEIDDTNAEVTRVENESKQRDTSLETSISTTSSLINGRIDTEVATLNERVTSEVATLNNTINTVEDTLDNKIDTTKDDIEQDLADGLATKIDKDISTNIVTAMQVSAHDRQPTIKITSKNTRTKEEIYDYIHFGTNGLIKVNMEDEDHLVVDSTDIDTINTQQNERLTNAEDRLDAHDASIASLFEHDVNHDRTLATHTSQIATHETRLDTDEDAIATLQNDLETEAGARESADNALSARITTNAVAITTKADRTFASDTEDKVVGKLESDTIANNELINLKQTLVSPQDGSSSVSNIKIISSDNTVIATRQSDGTIDLATNLDTDVNYFVTTDIINTTIASETVLDMNNLTATDKQVVEIQDIISDPEGTWGRVKSIDTENNTCTVVTFKKHAQAVWGTIKGTLSDQQDLQTILDDLQNQLYNVRNDLNNQIREYNQTWYYDVVGIYTSQNYVTFRRDDGVMLMARVMKSFTADSTQPTPYESFMLDCTNGNLQLIGIPEEHGEDTPEPNWEGIYDITMSDVISSDGQNPLTKTYRNLNSSNPNEIGLSFENPSEVDTLNVDITNYGTLEIPSNGHCEIVSVIANQEADYYDDEQKLNELISMSYIAGHSWVFVTQFNIEDEQERIAEVTTYTDEYDSNYTKLDVSNTSSDMVNISINPQYAILSDDLPMDLGEYTSTEIVITGLDAYDVQTAENLKTYILFQWIDAPQPDWEVINTFTLDNPTSSDSNVPVVEIQKDMNGVTSETLFVVRNNSQTDTLNFTYIPNSYEASVFTNDFGSYYTTSVLPDDVDLSYVENNFTFEWVTVGPQSATVFVNLEDTNGDPVYIANNCTFELEDVNDSSIKYTGDISDTDRAEFSNIPTGRSYYVNVIDNDGVYTQVSTITLNVTNENEYVTVIMQEKEVYYNDVMDILNSVDSDEEPYEGLGGTEEEVNEILDGILYGNNN